MAYYKTWQGCEIVFERKGHNFPMYVRNIRNGKVTWVTDYLYAKAYSEKTAKKHNEAIKAGLYEDTEDIDIRKTARKWSHATV